MRNIYDNEITLLVVFEENEMRNNDKKYQNSKKHTLSSIFCFMFVLVSIICLRYSR